MYLLLGNFQLLVEQFSSDSLPLQMTNFLKSTEGSRLVNAQPKAQKFFGISKTNVNRHFKATARAQYKANYKPVRAKVANGAAAVLAIIAIGK